MATSQQHHQQAQQQQLLLPRVAAAATVCPTEKKPPIAIINSLHKGGVTMNTPPTLLEEDGVHLKAMSPPEDASLLTHAATAKSSSSTCHVMPRHHSTAGVAIAAPASGNLCLEGQAAANCLRNLKMQRGSISYRSAMLNIRRYRLRASSCPDIYRNSMLTISGGGGPVSCSSSFAPFFSIMQSAESHLRTLHLWFSLALFFSNTLFPRT